MKRKWMLSLLGLAVTFAFLFPIYWMMISSLKSNEEIFSAHQTLFPEHIIWNSYLNIFKGDYQITAYIKNSLIISCGAMLGALLLATPAAYGIARRNLKLASLLLFFVLVVQMFPSNSLALPLYVMMNEFNMLNTYYGVIIANMTLSIPFNILVLRTFFLSVPKDLEDSAAIDGCTKWGTFYRIILPLVKPGILTCGTFSFLFAWGEFLYSFTLLDSKKYWPITLGMREFVGQHGSSWGELMALATVTSIPIILIFIFTQRYIVGGISAGAVKE